MRRLKYFFLVCLLGGGTFLNAVVYKNHAIAYVSYGDKTVVVTELDLLRPRFDGKSYTLDEYVFHLLVFLSTPIAVDSERVNRYIEKIKVENNLSDDDIKAIFSAAGYTYEQGCHEIAKMNIVQETLHYHVYSRVIVSKSDIETVYRENPIYRPGGYTLRRATFVKPVDVTPEDFIDQVNKKIVGKEEHLWGAVFVIQGDDIAKENAFIFQMNVGDVSSPRWIDDTTVEFFWLVEKSERELISLDRRYAAIVQGLKAPAIQALMKTYKKSLYEKAIITYL